MLTKLTRGNPITIAKPVIEKARLKAGSDYLEVEYREGIICLKPFEVEERIAPEIRVSDKIRLLYVESGKLAAFAFLGNHEQVRQYIKEFQRS